MCDEDLSLFFDDDFVREHLSFLMDDEFDDLFDGLEQKTSLHYRSYEEENSIYNTAKINTNLITSWSSSSSGSVSSSKEQASKYVNVCLRCEKADQPPPTSAATPRYSLSEADLGESSFQYDDNSFILDFPKEHTSTPTKKTVLDVILGDGSQRVNGGNAQLLHENQSSPQNAVVDVNADALAAVHLQCKFCLKNGEPPHVYSSHLTKNREGIVVCPILRKYVCDRCGQTGDRAHTRKYCALYPERTQEKPSVRVLSNGFITTNCCHK